MKATVLRRTVSLDSTTTPLEIDEVPTPVPNPGELLLRVGMQSVTTFWSFQLEFSRKCMNKSP